MAITFRPLSNRVLIARSPTEEKTPSGIIIPGNAQDKPSEGVVKAVGPGRVDDNGRLHEVRLKTGDRVLFGKFAGTEIKINGETLVMMSEDDVFGVIETK